MRLAVHEDGVARVPCGIEECKTLGGQRQVDADIGDHEAAFVGSAFHQQIHGRANPRARAVAGHQPVRPQLVAAFRGVHLHPCLLALLLDLVHTVTPAQLDQRVGLHCIDQVFLQVLLLQIDHGKEAVVVGTRVFHAKHTLTAVDAVAVAPGQSGLRHALGHAHLLQDFHGAAREHNGAAAFGHLQLGLEHHAALTVASNLQRRGQTHGAGADDDDGVVLLTWMPAGKPGLVHLVLVVDGAAWLGIWLMHVLVSWGRCRDQTVALPSPCGLA